MIKRNHTNTYFVLSINCYYCFSYMHSCNNVVINGSNKCVVGNHFANITANLFCFISVKGNWRGANSVILVVITIA